MADRTHALLGSINWSGRASIVPSCQKVFFTFADGEDRPLPPRTQQLGRGRVGRVALRLRRRGRGGKTDDKSKWLDLRLFPRPHVISELLGTKDTHKIKIKIKIAFHQGIVNQL